MCPLTNNLFDPLPQISLSELPYYFLDLFSSHFQPPTPPACPGLSEVFACVHYNLFIGSVYFGLGKHGAQEIDNFLFLWTIWHNLAVPLEPKQCCEWLTFLYADHFQRKFRYIFSYFTHESNFFASKFLASDKLVKKSSHVTLPPVASNPSSRSNITFSRRLTSLPALGFFPM